MYKKVLFKVFLPLLPAMAVLLATTENSVTVYNIPAGKAEAYSFFPAEPVTNLQLCTVLAAVVAVAALILALVYVATEKRWCLKGVFYAAFVSTCLAACLVLIQGDLVVVPNAIFSILMAVQCALAYFAGKKSEEKVFEPIRLKGRK